MAARIGTDEVFNQSPNAPGEVADSFARTRLSGRRGATYGTSDLGIAATATLLARVLPAP